MSTSPVVWLPLAVPGCSGLEMERTESCVHPGCEICSSCETKGQNSERFWINGKLFLKQWPKKSEIINEGHQENQWI